MSHALRNATADDQAAIEALIARSIRTLGADDYSSQQIESALRGAFGVDSQLIRDGTYFVVEAEGRIVGCGGWSRRRTLFGSDANTQRDATELDPCVDPARIRAFFVDPAHARKGIGRAILERCEAEARSCGFSRFELMATLPGVPLYRACGYVAGDAVEHVLEPGLAIRFVPMRKVASDNGAMAVLRIATRKSPLALWQSEHVASRLRTAHPGLEVVLVPLSTRGDEVLDRSLSAIGGKGLFLKELEVAMLRGEADCAVHSLKDVPMTLDGPFVLPAILERADHADAFVSNDHAGIDDLPRGAHVGTSSLRRQAQLRARRPDLVLTDLRGNVNTRLAKLDAGDYDAIVLACAGLQRLGFGDRIRLRLDAPDWLPAPAQGAIAIECRDDAPSVRALCAALDHAATRICVEAERAMNRALHGSCHVPVAALARQNDDGLWLQGMVGSADDGRLVRAESTGDTPESLGNTVAQRLLEGGAAAFLPMQPY